MLKKRDQAQEKYEKEMLKATEELDRQRVRLRVKGEKARQGVGAGELQHGDESKVSGPLSKHMDEYDEKVSKIAKDRLDKDKEK